MSKPSTKSGSARGGKPLVLEPLAMSVQLGARAYRALWNSIVAGTIDSSVQLRPDAVADQLDISTTPVREALYRLEADGIVVKLPYKGWYVRQFTEQEVRDLYEMRASLECFGVRLACERITDEQIAWLREHQAVGESALGDGDMEAYRVYNRDLHAAIVDAARNAYLTSVMAQVDLHSQVLVAKTIRLAGRPSRGIEEHRELIELITRRDENAAQDLMRVHILSASEDIIRYAIGTHDVGTA
jgi:DNA-binding GntR family transcriptional regulator